MSTNVLMIGRDAFRDKVFACWLGKNIGGTLGMPVETLLHTHCLDYFDPIPTEPAANDDLDLQLIWLQLLEDHGTDPPLPYFAEYWKRHAASYPWCEYGFFMRNYDRGLRPPVAGCFENYFVDEMGSPIRSEIWACLHAGDPQAAARMAWKDSAVDHAGGEGTCGEMFWSALQAAAFVESEPMTLIRIGLSMIPLSSHFARSVREALWCHENGLSWGRARERIATRFGSVQPCNAVVNGGFAIIGWLYGNDFGDMLCKAVNCGYDTDCTAATLGATLGIIGGSAVIPDRWRKPVGTDIALHRFTRNLNAPSDLDELADRTVALAEKAALVKEDIAFSSRTVLPADLATRLFRSDLARRALAQDIHAGRELCGGREVTFHYGREPVLRPNVGRVVRVTLDSEETARVDLAVPSGWTCRRLGPAEFLIISGPPIADRNTVTVTLDGGDCVSFTILGPSEAKGYGAGDWVPVCGRCHARVEACICQKQ